MTNFWIANCLLAFALAVLFAGVLIPQILLISFRKSLFDEPNARKIHTSTVPRLGGLAFMPVVCFTFVFLFGLGVNIYGSEFTRFILPYAGNIASAACALMMLYIIGMADDLVGVKYRAKFVVQILCGCLLISGGVWFTTFCGFFGLNDVGPWLGWPITVFATVFIINAINLIDGIDGLASGLCSICLLTYGIVYAMTEEWAFALLSFASVGVLVPFFYYNVFGNPDHQKKIFMGDTGSLTIGMMITFLGIRILQLDIEEPMRLHNINMMVVAFTPLIIPCFDVVRVYGERFAAHRSPFMPDKRHIHHKLLALGWSQRKAMIILIAISLFFSIANIVISQWVDINILLVLDALAAVFAVYTVNRAIQSKRPTIAVASPTARLRSPI